MNQSKIIIAIGGNVNSADGLHPIEVGKKSIKLMNLNSMTVEKQSSWYISNPVPKSDQPNFFNCVVIAKTTLNEFEVLTLLHKIESNLGRKRKKINEARSIDLDLIDYSSKIFQNKNLIIPHPRAHLRKFVMQPLAEIDINWMHPIFKLSVSEILNQLGSQEINIYCE